jgi:hypothetical protein
MYAKKLLRIDKTSRQRGRYALMEKELYKRFKDRRAHARKTSVRWIVHMARHLVKTQYPVAAGAEKVLQSWARVAAPFCPPLEDLSQEEDQLQEHDLGGDTACA